MLISLRRAGKATLSLSLEIIVGAVILNYSLKWFLFYWFLHNIFWLSSKFDYARAQTRVYQVFNECKLLALMQRLNVAPEDVAKVYEDERSKWPDKNVKTFAEDYTIIST